MGRLTAEPKLKATASGVSVTNFSFAVDRPYIKQNKKTDFINVVAWRQTAEFICRHFVKGQLMAIDGSIETRRYTLIRTELNVRTLKLLWKTHILPGIKENRIKQIIRNQTK